MADERKFHGQELREAHAMAIGKIAMAWNEYHETLGEIFAEFFGDDSWQRSLAAWHALDSDRSQRKMLLAVAASALPEDAKGLLELRWLIGQTDLVIAAQRNDGVHMPLMSFTDTDGNHSMFPLVLSGNRRALKMMGKDVLAQYAHYEMQIRKMCSFAIAVQFNLSTKHQQPEDWPDRPKLSRWAPERT